MWSVQRPAPDSHTGQAQPGTARCCENRRFPASATVNSASATQIVEYSAASISSSGLPHPAATPVRVAADGRLDEPLPPALQKKCGPHWPSEGPVVFSLCFYTAWRTPGIAAGVY